LPAVYYPSYRLNYFRIEKENDQRASARNTDLPEHLLFGKSDGSYAASRRVISANAARPSWADVRPCALLLAHLATFLKTPARRASENHLMIINRDDN
jgi:hypothetical protein